MVPPTESSPEDVFINCPFDDDYRDIFRALIFVVYACGFRPRSARELDDGGKTRIAKLYDIIGESRYGIHDISRTELDVTHQLPRFNMPLELGIFLGAKQYGNASQRRKLVLIFDTEPYRFQKFISDLAGMDIHAHRFLVARSSFAGITSSWRLYPRSQTSSTWTPRRPAMSTSRRCCSGGF